MNPLLSALVQAGLMPQQDADHLARQLDSNLAREYAEQQMLLAFQAGLAGQRDRLLDIIRANDGVLSMTQQNRFWAGENERLWNSVRDTILDVASERAVVAAIDAGGVDTWELINDDMVDYAENYYTSTVADDVGSIPNLNQTSRQRVGQAVADWQRGTLTELGPQEGLPDLIRALESTFGATRAETIGVTETTRIFTEGIRVAEAENPFTTQWEWLTANDELVCPLCGPRAGQRIAKRANGFGAATDTLVGFPPIHVRCRCQIIALTDLAADGVPEVVREAVAVTPVPEPVEETAQAGAPASQWKASMSRQEAETWSANSAYKDDVYHVTPGVANARSIAANGFDLDRTKFGKMWGEGVYVGADPETAEMYRRWTGSSARTLTIKTNIANPFVYTPKRSGFGHVDIVQEALGVSRARASKIWSQAGTLDQVLSEAGYDALHIVARPSVVGEGAGGNQLVVFDPKNVVVIDE